MGANATRCRYCGEARHEPGGACRTMGETVGNILALTIIVVFVALLVIIVIVGLATANT